MAQFKYCRIRFNEDLVTGSAIQIMGSTNNGVSITDYNILFNWVDSRTGPNQVPTGTPISIVGEKTAIDFENYLLLDYDKTIVYKQYTIQRYGNVVIMERISNIVAGCAFYGEHFILKSTDPFVLADANVDYSNSPFVTTTVDVLPNVSDSCNTAVLHIVTDNTQITITNIDTGEITTHTGIVNQIDVIKSRGHTYKVEGSDGSTVIVPVYASLESSNVNISYSGTELNVSINGVVPINDWQNYQYSLNGTDYQDWYIFENVEYGNYTVYIKDRLGCVKTFFFDSSVNLLLCRSPYNVRVIPNVNFDNVEMSLYIWNGSLSNIPTLPNYNLSKQVIQLGQPVVSFDISNLVKENIESKINGYQLSGVGASQLQASTWVRFEVNAFNGLELVYTHSQVVIGIYGYGYFNEGYNPSNPSNVLISGNNHFMVRNNDYRIYFLTANISQVTVNGQVFSFEFERENNYENIASINLKDLSSIGNDLEIIFNYSNEIRVIKVSLIDECKYDVVNCVFINKYGFPQSFHFSKISKKSTNIDSEEYLGLTSDFGIYSTTQHQNKSFNLNSKSKISVNSGYIIEELNETIKQLSLSESIWTIENGIIYPVNLDSKSIEFKTKKVDKLINYSMTFNYSFNDINNVV